MRSTLRTLTMIAAAGLVTACSDSPTAPQVATTDGGLLTPPVQQGPTVDTLPFVAQTLQSDSAIVRLLVSRGAGSFLDAVSDETPRSFRPVRDTAVVSDGTTGTVIRGSVRAQTVRTGQVEATFRVTRTTGRDSRALSVAIPIAMRLDEATAVISGQRRTCALDSTAVTYAVRCGTADIAAGDSAVVTIRGTQRVSVIEPVGMTAFHGMTTVRLPITAIATHADLARLDLTTPGVVQSGQRVAIGLNVNSTRSDTLQRMTALVAVLPSRDSETLPATLTPDGLDGRFNPGDLRGCVPLMNRAEIMVWRCAMDGGVRVGLTRLTTGGRMDQSGSRTVQDYRVIVGLLSVDGIRHGGIERFAQTSVRLRR